MAKAKAPDQKGTSPAPATSKGKGKGGKTPNHAEAAKKAFGGKKGGK